MRVQRLTPRLAFAAGLILLGSRVQAQAPGFGDYNHDGKVDLADYAEFPGCMGGPDVPYGVGCYIFDFEAGSDVDLMDFADFQRVFGAPGVAIDTVTIGNPGNLNDSHGDGYGGVGYTYKIGKYEVTAGQYTEFLNAVASTDTYGLYNTGMNSDSYGCQITRNGASGDYTYDFSGRPSGTEADWADRPVNYVSWGDAARFANWLHNGQPSGAQDLTTTEDGSYFLDGAVTGDDLLAITREADATWVIPSEDEWYKAAYHKNDGVTRNYRDYPTCNDGVPVPESCQGGSNSANFLAGSHAIGPPYYRNEVGCYVASGSCYGTFDQGGNVWEWSETGTSDSSRGVRGGSFDRGSVFLRAASRASQSPLIEGNGVGFRVAEVP